MKKNIHFKLFGAEKMRKTLWVCCLICWAVHGVECTWWREDGTIENSRHFMNIFFCKHSSSTSQKKIISHAPPFYFHSANRFNDLISLPNPPRQIRKVLHNKINIPRLQSWLIKISLKPRSCQPSPPNDKD